VPRPAPPSITRPRGCRDGSGVVKTARASRALAAMAAARVSPESKMAARAVRHLGVTADSGLATAAGIDGRCEAKAARARVR
jgi:hypothetical protein